MAAKRITWKSATECTVEILDGPAVGAYHVDIERDIPIGGYLAVGEIRLNGRRTQIRVATADIAEYDARYHASPKGLRAERRNLVVDLQGAYQDARRARDKWFDDEMARGACPQYASPTIDAARAALVKFDEAHPEVKAQAEADSAEATKRYMQHD